MAKRIRQQPRGIARIDWSNPITLGLAAATYAQEQPCFVDMVSGKFFNDSHPFDQSHTNLRRSPEGNSRASRQGSAHYVIPINARAAERGRCTLITILKPKALVGTAQRYVSTAGEFLGGWNMARIYIVNDKLSGDCVNSGTLSANTTYNLGQVYVVGVTHNGHKAETDRQRLYIDGVMQDATGSYVLTSKKLDTFKPIIGAGATDNLSEVYASFVWDRELSKAEMKSIAEDPYQLFVANDRRNRRLLISATEAPPAGDINVTPGAGPLSITGNAPTVTRSGNINVTPLSGALSITGNAPEIAQSAHGSVTAYPGALSVVGHAPVIAQSAHQALVAPPGALSITGNAPEIAQSAHMGVVASPGVLAAVGHAPVIAQSSHQAVVVDTSNMTITGHVPVIEQTGPLYPPVHLVTAGTTYGPNRNDFTGTYVGGLTAQQNALLTALAKIHGLVAGSPLVVTQTTRSAGGVAQTISETNGAVTIELTNPIGAETNQGTGGMTADQHAMLMSLAMINGLVDGAPLIVTQSARTAGTVTQTISESNGAVTIERA